MPSWLMALNGNTTKRTKEINTYDLKRYPDTLTLAELFGILWLFRKY